MKQVALVTLLVIFATAMLTAHHSASAEFVTDKIIEVKGTVTKIDWINPHPVVFLDAKDASGNITHWKFQIPSPVHELERRGWARTTVQIGAVITGKGAPAKRNAGPNDLSMAPIDVVLSDGTKFETSSKAWAMVHAEAK